MRILYFMDAMHYGGAAKKTTMIANELARRGHDVRFVTDTHYPIGFSLEDSIQIVQLYEEGSIRSNRLVKVLCKLKRVRRIVSTIKPEVVISVLPHVSFYVKIALLGKKMPIIFSDETSFARKDSRIFHFIRHRFYNLADAVVVLTENDVRLLGENIPQKVAIHNPVVCPVFNGDYASKKKTVLAIGPLEEWDIKGFDLLFKAFGPLVNDFPEWNLVIAGYSREPYKTKVVELIKESNLDTKVFLLGYRSDIFNVMAQASIYAMSSRVEGFSLSLVESISQGCACVAFAIHGVMEEVSCGGKGVLIVEDGDVVAFSDSLRQLMSDEDLRIRLANEGLTCVKEYSLNTIVDKWEALFGRLLSIKK